MKVMIYWFRNDLRLTDNPAFVDACLHADFLLPVYIHSPQSKKIHALGFPRESDHRQAFLRESLDDLRGQLRNMGSDLLEYAGEPVKLLSQLVELTGADTIYCERIEAPEEIHQCQQIKALGISLHEFWQSSMLSLDKPPFPVQEMPDMFTQFRKEIERAGLKFESPVTAPSTIPPLPKLPEALMTKTDHPEIASAKQWIGGERNATAHLKQYLERRLPDSYKETRNQLIGQDYSSKFSPWLASGCISARTIAAELAAYEQCYGANDGTYWLWFELMWRDYFRFLHFKYGRRLYLEKGLSELPLRLSDDRRFDQWRSGKTGVPLVDAGMRELLQSGYLSNRMRQIVASYWVYDLQGDWRLGARWFESQLIDYDVYSNQGNWLYLAGRGTDPRGGRRFNIAKQTQDHDPQGKYQSLWL
ncbi:DASH family cryptochrome [Polynucleobacter sp. CS-Odin-A6]|uniref:DASH family cryptochrome n=1 Tax=Polynucleobacter sp. CS-Odin-A6 TaxID=2689106 RepID=UPI001C0C3B9B|nr:DASH family cryptochrome [Polynucleobacter sp. CS-Odin-A6]MBU3620471.1 DASH family cryptochrome [Polynucleobacter sp. CS-Odin-A6]